VGSSRRHGQLRSGTQQAAFEATPAGGAAAAAAAAAAAFAQPTATNVAPSHATPGTTPTVQPSARFPSLPATASSASAGLGDHSGWFGMELALQGSMRRP